MDKLDEWMNNTVGSTEKKSTDSQQKSSNNNQLKAKKKGFFSRFKKNSSNNQGKQSKQNKPQNKNKQNNPNKQKNFKKKNPKNTGNKNQQKNAQKQPVKLKHPKLPKKQLSQTPIIRGKIKIIPLGGLDEVGKNLMAIEYENDIVIIDMGFEFPSEDMLGIDYVIPDTAYLEANKRRIRGVVLTHGHLDHIGGLPYILPKLDYPPVYGAKLTIGLAEHRIKEFKQEKLAKLHTFKPSETLRLGKITCSFFRVAHSIPDAVGVIIDTPAGKIVHTGDFKFDPTPPRNMQMADIAKIEALGKQNVLALFCESTNSVKSGHTMSEKDVGEVLDKVVGESPGRILIASFSSQIGRVQQIIDAAVKHGRKIYVSGRSMKTNIDIAFKLGYISFPKGSILDMKKYKNSKSPDKETLIITTGSQGEAFSALGRISRNEHAHIKIKKTDRIILSSSPIIGNERAIHTVINNLCILGAEVIHNKLMDIHTSGHGQQEELVRMISSVNPKYLIPIHGEYYMRQALASLAQKRCGVPEEKIIMIQNGDVLLAGQDKVEIAKEKIETKYILIDGNGEGNIGSRVQVEREIMSQNGALIIMLQVSKKNGALLRRPDIMARGFIYMHETEILTKEIAAISEKAYREIKSKRSGATRNELKKYVRQTVDKFTHKQLERTPLIIPILVER